MACRMGEHAVYIPTFSLRYCFDLNIFQLNTDYVIFGFSEHTEIILVFDVYCTAECIGDMAQIVKRLPSKQRVWRLSIGQLICPFLHALLNASSNFFSEFAISYAKNGYNITFFDIHIYHTK